MKFCNRHWGALRAAIDERGLMPLVARNGAEAVERAKEELGGTATDASYDPLMGAHWMIVNRALESGGLYLMTGEICPVCEAIEHCNVGEGGYRDKKHIEEDWIEGPADAALEFVRSKPELCALLGWESP